MRIHKRIRAIHVDMSFVVIVVSVLSIDFLSILCCLQCLVRWQGRYGVGMCGGEVSLGLVGEFSIHYFSFRLIDFCFTNRDYELSIIRSGQCFEEIMYIYTCAMAISNMYNVKKTPISLERRIVSRTPSPICSLAWASRSMRTSTP